MITIPIGPTEHVKKPKLTIQTSMSGDGRRLYMVNSVDMMEFRRFMDYALHSTGRYTGNVEPEKPFRINYMA